MTMDSWRDSSGLDPAADLLLQMDIEGGEYAAIMSMSDKLMRRFRIMVIEFHDLDGLLETRPLTHYLPLRHRIVAAFTRLLKTHICVHIHPNNVSHQVIRENMACSPEMEFTFLRKDRARITGYQTEFPHRLDYDNVSHKPHVPLPADWYHQD